MHRMRQLIQRISLKLFPLAESVGLHVIPAHYYYPVPFSRDLDDALFERLAECVGLDWNPSIQTFYLQNIFANLAREKEFENNSGLSLVDSAILHAMIRYHKPLKMIEIGSGNSTLIAADACLMNERDGSPCELIAIEPYPTTFLEKGVPGLRCLRKQKVQSVPLAEFADCDLLFIDSSHVVKIGGDVNYELLEIIPRVKPGCLIHFHDILLPGEYWKEWVIGKRYFWTEQYLLWAFLLFNCAFEVVWASRYMHLHDAEGIRRVFPYFEPERHHITSFWIRRKKRN